MEAVQQTIEERINSNDKVPSWAKDIAIKNMTARKDFHDNKVNELSKIYTERIKEFLSIYFNGFSETPEENQVSFDLLNKEWKLYVNNANRTQKYIKLKTDIFEVEVKRISETDERFKPKEIEATKE